MTTMPRPKSDNQFQVAFKIPEEWREKAEKIAADMSRDGLAAATRTDILRAAVERGLEDIAEEVAKKKGSPFSDDGLMAPMILRKIAESPERGGATLEWLVSQFPDMKNAQHRIQIRLDALHRAGRLKHALTAKGRQEAG